jgi:hypothetical protein
MSSDVINYNSNCHSGLSRHLPTTCLDYFVFPYLKNNVFKNRPGTIIPLEVGFSGWFEIGSPVTKRSTSTGCPTKTGIDMDTPEESRVSRSAKEGRIGPGGTPSSQKSPFNNGMTRFSSVHSK